MKNKVIYAVTIAGMASMMIGAIAGRSAHQELCIPLMLIGAVIIAWFILANANKKAASRGSC